MSRQKQMNRTVRELTDVLHEMAQNMTGQELLEAIGLQRYRPSTKPAVGMFALGLIVGASVGYLTAPKPGREIRGDLRRGVDQVRERREAPRGEPRPAAGM